jgi:predicted ATP-grasp superfamily ATP-dependent carboligase
LLLSDDESCGTPCGSSSEIIKFTNEKPKSKKIIKKNIKNHKSKNSTEKQIKLISCS